MGPNSIPIRPVILSGGSGTRLWPLSREDRPKQFLALTGGDTMLSLTVQRMIGKQGFQSPVIVANARHRSEIEGQIAEAGLAVDMILEPVGRNTAPAITIVALRAPPETILLVMPSDHVIADLDTFEAAISVAIPIVLQGYLVTLGIEPDSPETGYGYIRRGAELSPGVYRAERFVEKPDLKTARSYAASRRYSWNAGIFLFRARDYLSALVEYAPEILEACEAAVRNGQDQGSCFLPEEQAFSGSPSISIDYAVMEKTANVAVVPVSMGWSDIGSWDALYDYLATADGECGGADPNVLQRNSTGCLIRSDGPTVAVVGVKDLIVIATRDGVLVMPRGHSQQVKEIVEELNRRKN